MYPLCARQQCYSRCDVFLVSQRGSLVPSIRCSISGFGFSFPISHPDTGKQTTQGSSCHWRAGFAKKPKYLRRTVKISSPRGFLSGDTGRKVMPVDFWGVPRVMYICVLRLLVLRICVGTLVSSVSSSVSLMTHWLTADHASLPHYCRRTYTHA